MGQFKTYQKTASYEDSLSRHNQWVRWMQGINCPCVQSDTGQANPSCKLCKGRGKIYETPKSFKILQERVHHDNQGRIFPPRTPVVAGSCVAYLGGVELPLDATQPSDGSYIQLAEPYPRAYEAVFIDYTFSTHLSIESENSDVYGALTLRTINTRYTERGKSFEGSIVSVSRVYNATRDETYTVVDAVKEYIYLESMGSWESGDILEVDYIYVKPFGFMLNGITPRLRYEQPYVLEEADAILVTPYWAKVAPDDLITAMASEQVAQAVINPKIASANDVVISYFDLSYLIRVLDATGKSYTVGPGNDVEVYGRNEIKWNVTKPSVQYTVQFAYHPTFTAISNLHTLRNAENKMFVNRVSVRLFDHVHEKVVY